jgi:Phage integrase, N-terminal SAM-like domain
MLLVTATETPFVGGVGDAVERLGGVLPGREHADVIDDDEVAAADPGLGPGDGPVGLGPGDRGGQRFEGEPGDAQVLLDGGVGQGLDQVRLAGAGRYPRGPRPALNNVYDHEDDLVLPSLLPSYLRGFSDEKEQGAMAYCLAVRPAGGDRTWTVVDASYATVGPVEEWLEAHRHLWSLNTVRGYATSLAQWWSFLEQRGEAGRWTEAGVPAVSGFLSWLRNGRTVEHALTVPADAPAAETLHARLAALISFYQWQEAVHSVPVAGWLLRGRAARMPSRGLLAHLDGRREPGPSSLVKVRRHRAGRPPLLPQEIQAIIDGCAAWDDAAGEWRGNLRDRLLFSLLAESGKMMRPRRVGVPARLLAAPPPGVMVGQAGRRACRPLREPRSRIMNLKPGSACR